MIIKSKDVKWVEETLKEFPFIMWDRFFGNSIVTVFGWIDRQKDAYKDFVVLTLYLKTKRVYFIATSSEKYSEEIAKIIGENWHDKCERIEDNFKILNSIRLPKSDNFGTEKFK